MLCPACKKSDKVVQSGWTNGLRRCASHFAPVFLYGRAYRCKGCPCAATGAKDTCFNAYDADVIRALPPAISRQLPFVLTRRGAMWRADVDLLERCSVNIADFCKAMRELAARR